MQKANSYDKRKSSAQALKCSQCATEFENKNQLKKHYKFSHLCEEIKEKDCKYCDKKFRENFELEVHLKSYSETESYTCDRCDKTFVIK